MRRWGAILMILGVNIAVASLAAAFWRASFDCALVAAGSPCGSRVFGLFAQLMTSVGGIVYWVAVAVGLAVFWRGKRMRSG